MHPALCREILVWGETSVGGPGACPRSLTKSRFWGLDFYVSAGCFGGWISVGAGYLHPVPDEVKILGVGFLCKCWVLRRLDFCGGRVFVSGPFPSWYFSVLFKCFPPDPNGAPLSASLLSLAGARVSTFLPENILVGPPEAAMFGRMDGPERYFRSSAGCLAGRSFFGSLP